MRWLVTTLALLFMALILVPPASAQDAPPRNNIPDLKNAPIQINCSRNKPTVIHTKVFVNKAAGWKVNIFGRNKKDISLTVIPAAGMEEMEHFLSVDGAWKPRKGMTDENLMKVRIGDLYYSDEELNFLRECVKESMPK